MAELNILRARDDLELDQLEFSSYSKEDIERDNARLFVNPSSQKPPKWLDIIRSLLSQETLNQIVSQNPSFIYAELVSGRIYFITGGHTYQAIKGYLDDDFGVEVALRLIKEENLRQIFQRQLRGSTKQIFRTVRDYMPGFDPLNYGALVKELKGRGEFMGKTITISGSHGLHVRSDFSIERFPELIKEIERILEKEDPKIPFPRSFIKVKQPTLIQSLDKLMVDELNDFLSGSILTLSKSYFELSNLEAIIKASIYRCTHPVGTVTKKGDFSLEFILNGFKKFGLSSVDVSTLRNVISSEAFDGNDVLVSESRLYRDIISEQFLNNKEYIKIEDQWYEILNDVKAYLDEEVAKIPINKTVLPPWAKRHVNENDYNEDLANTLGGKCLDRRLVYVGKYNGIEVCDVYDQSTLTFFHVKKTWAAKSSYLFKQGEISGQLMMREEQFRNKVIHHWPNEFNSFSPDQVYTVIFGIAHKNASNSQWNNFPLNMTFTAKSSLVSAVQSLRALGLEVELSTIDIM